jgi:hypothetical protein
MQHSRPGHCDGPAFTYQADHSGSAAQYAQYEPDRHRLMTANIFDWIMLPTHLGRMKLPVGVGGLVCCI